MVRGRLLLRLPYPPVELRAWDGKAAEASRTAISNYAGRAEDLTDALNALASRVGSAKDGVSNTKNGVDVPIQHVSILHPADGDFLWHHGNRSLSKINEERDKAREAMKNNYVANMVSADKSIPVIPKPTSPTDPLYTYTYTYTYTSGSTPNSGPSNSGSGPGGTHNSGSGSGGSSDSGSGTGSQSGTSSSTSTSPSSYQSSNNSSSLSTVPSSYLSGLSSNASTLPSSFTGGTGTGTGSGGYDGGGGGGGLGTTSGGGLGKSVPGTGGGTNTGTAAAAAATRAGAGATGMAGMGGMGAANKGKGEDDKDHQLPEWLRTMENAEELLGPQPKTLPGGVIGGNYDQHDPPGE